MHLDAGAAGADIDNIASDGLAFRIGKNGAGLGDQSAGPHPMKAPVFWSDRHDEFREKDISADISIKARLRPEGLPGRGRFVHLV